MRSDDYDRAKIISDFMSLGMADPEDKAWEVFRVKHSLSPHGFEKYIQYYFQKLRHYSIGLNGNTYDYDGGIDLIGLNGEKRIYVQCKKYTTRDISEQDVRSFVGGVYIKNVSLNDDDVILYYITTSKFTLRAKEYAQKANVECVDFLKIYKLSQKYSLEEFESDLLEKEGIKAKERSFNKKQLSIPNYDKGLYLENTEVFELLKQVRRDISYIHNSPTWVIAKDNTLTLLSKRRPQNLEALKGVINECELKEQSKLQKHGKLFMKRLKLV